MRYSLSHYGWIVILILILSLLITLATPFGNYVYNSTEYITNAFLGVTYEALKLDRPILGGEDCFYADKYGTLRIKPKYLESYLPRLIGEIAEENNMSVKEVCKYLEYSVFVKNVNINDWKQLAVSDKDMNEIIGANFADSLSLKENVDNALQQYPYMKTSEQVILNYVYLTFVENCSSDIPGLSYDGHNVTRAELNELAAKIATAMHEQALTEAQTAFPDEDDVDTLIQKCIYALIADSAPEPLEYKKNTIREYADDFGIDEFLINIYENLITALLKSPEKATPDDLMVLVVPDFIQCNIDDLINLAKDTPTYDYNKAFLFLPYIGGFSVSTIVEHADTPKLPSRFNIPESYNGVTITTIPAKFFDDYDYFDHIKAIHLPSTIKTIGEQAFSDCRNLEQINLENVSSLGAQCFKYTSLTHIELSPELIEIPVKAFYDTPLEYIKINNGTQTIAQSAFGNCANIELIYIPNSVVTFNNFSLYAKAIIYTPIGSPAEEYAKSRNIAYINANSIPDYYEVLRK